MDGEGESPPFSPFEEEGNGGGGEPGRANDQAGMWAAEHGGISQASPSTHEEPLQQQEQQQEHHRQNEQLKQQHQEAQQQHIYQSPQDEQQQGQENDYQDHQQHPQQPQDPQDQQQRLAEEINGHASPLHLQNFNEQQQRRQQQQLSFNDGMEAEPMPAETPVQEHQLLQQQSQSGNKADTAISLMLTPTPTNNAGNTAANNFEFPASELKQPPQPPPAANFDDDVIELSSDDDEGGSGESGQNSAARMPASAGAASYSARNANTPDWMLPSTGNVNMPNTGGGYGQHTIQPGYSLNGYNQQQQMQQQLAKNHYINNQPVMAPAPQYNYQPAAVSYQQPRYQAYVPEQIAFDVPEYAEFPADFTPTWPELVPADLIKPPKAKPAQQKKNYQLTLVNLKEFTITGLSIYNELPPPVAGLRSIIKRVSREHGKPVFEKDAGGTGSGRWKIPIGAYQQFYSYLVSDPDVAQVNPIPQEQLKVASLGRARLEKDYPSAEKLVERGVPFALAKTLAPFQRGGVDFVLEKEGKALIADDMGLGKTIQSVASMSVYHKEWPLLVLTPSGARYHWESEFRNWLGANGAAAKNAKNITKVDEAKPSDPASSDTTNENSFEMLQDSQIHVLTSSKDPVLPNKDTRVVVCSYGLAPMLVENGRILPGMFPCAIADESHMLKNMKSKRTKYLVPILRACKRCVLLSGTPALAKPAELWPQLMILDAQAHGFWGNEFDFMNKYAKNVSTERRGELHTMLTGTLMIRRMKDDILKDMPKKAREKALVKVESQEMRTRMQECMKLLREGKGVLGNLAREHTAVSNEPNPPVGGLKSDDPSSDRALSNEEFHQLLDGQRAIESSLGNEASLEQQTLANYQQRQHDVRQTLATRGHRFNAAELSDFLQEMDIKIRNELQAQYQERFHAMHHGEGGASGGARDEPPSRGTVLNQMYSLTGKAKLPALVAFMKKWLEDPAKGKLCVFAHHTFVLDAIVEELGLSNSGAEGTYPFIRIDGKTTPRTRQDQIDTFQTDPSTRIAVLGITAAGVAVTLTAASQVVFAELFWTPAIMIQAEDRCHRIGQQAKVHCIYFVATGTLDEILWKLLEKKFRELGEFVEGKEKLNMIVHKTYKSQEELHAMFIMDGVESEDDEEEDVLRQTNEPDIIPLDSELQHDIEELAREEQDMLRSADADRDDDDVEVVVTAHQITNGEQLKSEADEKGRSQDDAIALDDSEDEAEDAVAVVRAIDPANYEIFNRNGAFPDCKLYKLTTQGPTLGVEISICLGRVVVVRKMQEKIERLGKDCKPNAGDVLVGVGGVVVPQGLQNVDQVRNFIVRALQRPPVVLWFVEDQQFHDFYNTWRAKNPDPVPIPAPANKKRQISEVIELDD